MSQQNKYAIVFLVVGEKMDQERLETKPLLETGSSGPKVTVESDMSSKEDHNPKSKESLANECAEDKEH
jgi:hypothetical protein